MSVDVQMFRRTGLSEAVVYRVGVARVDGSSPAPRLQVVPGLPVPPAEQPACPVLEHKKTRRHNAVIIGGSVDSFPLGLISFIFM